jgi:ribose 5-phosphate isomerase A
MIFNTDNGNLIYDCKFPPMADPVRIEQQLRERAGIVGTGLFLGIAHTVLIADDSGVKRMDRA